VSDNDQRREDADYAIWRANGSFGFKDKRTGHRCFFDDCQPRGFGGYVFLYHYPNAHVDDPSPSIGFKSAHLDKDSLPDWLIEEFHSINDTGELTPATDPRSDN